MADPALWLFAQRSRWERLGDGLRGESAELSALEIGFLAAVLVFVLLGTLWLHRLARKREGTLPYKSPRGLFRELCRAHGLDHWQRLLLKNMAVSYNLADPAVLFVEPRYYSPAQLPAAIRDESAEIARLGELLFGEADAAPD